MELQQVASKECPVALQKWAVQHPHSLRYSTEGFVDLLKDLNEERRDLSLIHNAVVEKE